jgi:hypothetical protein
MGGQPDKNKGEKYANDNASFFFFKQMVVHTAIANIESLYKI